MTVKKVSDGQLLEHFHCKLKKEEGNYSKQYDNILFNS